MSLYILIIIFVFLFAYFSYGKFLEKNFRIQQSEELPSKKFQDGVDFVPTNKFVLLGHHFSSIAGAGPIVGPILAGLSFGWGPSLAWIILGTIFIGGLHDFSSLVISIRHNGLSVAQIANKYINKTTYKIFLLFIWLSLIYVVAVFADLAADSFALNPSVAQISIWYIIVAIIFGILVYRLRFNIITSTIITLTLILIGILLSLQYKFIFAHKQTWVVILLLYAFCASIVPVWFLLQPRDYLSSYFLYFTVIVGIVGLLFGKNSISYPVFISFYSKSIGPLIPFMFITIACGAISGFHSLVASGTTSKQLDEIKNARFVAYGGMILEGVVASIALATVMMLNKTETVRNPQQIYALGIAKFAEIFGMKPEVGEVVGYLAISAFILTTLDTATRIARYIFQEFTEKLGNKFSERIIATICSLILPIIFLFWKIKDSCGNVIPCWKVVWPIFGSTNQLLAALVLLIVYTWVRKEKFNLKLSIIIPVIFMLVITLSALVYNVYIKLSSLTFDVITISSVFLLLLGIFIIYKSTKIFITK